MKKLLILPIMAGLVFTASADLTSFRWINGSPTALTDELGAPIAIGAATVLTYISTDNVINFDVMDALFNGIGLTSSYGNDTLVYTMGNVGAFAGQLITPFMTESDAGDNYQGMYTYAVVVNKPIAAWYADGGYTGRWSPEHGWIGEHFGLSSIIGGPLTDPDAPNTPQSLNPGSVQTNYQVIPEPATLGLMSIAGISMFLARRKTRR